MRNHSLPNPPDPNDPAFSSDTKAYRLAVYRWQCQMKSEMEANSRINFRTLPTNFIPTAFTTSTAITGADAVGNVANVLCTLLQAMISRGLIATQKFNQ